MIKEPSIKTTKTTERYELGTILIPDYHAGGEIGTDVGVVYTREVNDLGAEPIRECARFISKRTQDYFSGNSIYGGYVKYTLSDGSMKRMFLFQPEESPKFWREIAPDKLADPHFVDTKRWDQDLVSLIDQLPSHVRDLFNL